MLFTNESFLLQDLRVQIIRGKYDRDRDRNSRGERRPYDRSSSEKRKDKNPDQEERKNRILMADKMAEEKRKEAEARKKTKLLEQVFFTYPSLSLIFHLFILIH